MKIVLPGGSGQVGTLLARAFMRDGHEVVIVGRTPPARPLARFAQWDGQTVAQWAAELAGADAVVNLAGRSVNCRYSARNRREIIESRVNSTRAVGAAIHQCVRPPRVWLQASTATIYAHRYDSPNDEATGMLGGDEPDAPETWRFSIDVARQWENALTAALPLPSTRTVLMRSAIVLSPDRRGIFDVLLGLVRHGLGGRAGHGRQFTSWIHEHDFVQAVYRLIEKEYFHGPVILAAPNPVPNAEFMRILRQAWGTRFGLPAPRFILEIGTALMRTESELVLKSRRVYPGRLSADGFTFQYPHWREAAAELCARWRKT
jgi:uncharacterized protein (TIGR01777 family)